MRLSVSLVVKIAAAAVTLHICTHVSIKLWRRQRAREQTESDQISGNLTDSETK